MSWDDVRSTDHAGVPSVFSKSESATFGTVSMHQMSETVAPYSYIIDSFFVAQLRLPQSFAKLSWRTDKPDSSASVSFRHCFSSTFVCVSRLVIMVCTCYILMAHLDIVID